jgi:hypothetical protein
VTDAAVQTGAAVRRVALFVLGMPRSGTSALTRVLSLRGGTLPAGLLAAVPDNPLGHWEPRASLVLNYETLCRHGSGAYDPTLRLQEEGAFDADERAACIAEIGSNTKLAGASRNSCAPRVATAIALGIGLYFRRLSRVA